MITPKITALFQFIDYLYSNIDKFNQNNKLINDLELLDKKRQKVRNKSAYKEKLEYDKVQAEIERKFKKLQDNTANPIKAKAKELNVCNFDNEPEYSFKEVESEINQLKENFSKEDLPEIFKHKSHYIEYRTKTHQTFLSLQFFFDDLDEIAKDLFDFFKDTKHNEFEGLETKAIPVNTISEAANLFQQGHTKFILSNDFLSHDKGIINNTTFNFTEAYNKEVTNERIKKLKIEVSKIEDIDKKILFLENEKIEYLQNVPPEIIEVSGTTYLPNFKSGEPLFFDRIIQLEIDKYKMQLKSPQAETKTDKLKAELGKYGFFELSKINQLSEPNKQSLIELIITNGLPYSIAMFDFLGFLKHIEIEHFKTKIELNKEVAKWFNSDKEGRHVKGNISSLSDYTLENKSRYTAHTHKETVKTDYQRLK